MGANGCDWDALRSRRCNVFSRWKSGDATEGAAKAFEFTVGRAPYQIGHGLLLWDGAGDGGSRGGFWTCARKAWEFASVGRFKTKMHTLEAFFVSEARGAAAPRKNMTRYFGEPGDTARLLYQAYALP